MPQSIKQKPVAAQPYSPTGEERDVLDFLEERVLVLKQTKRRVLNNLNFEEIMRDADAEYQPHNLRERGRNTGKIMLIQDEVKGLRGSRIVPITGQEGNEWRSDVSEPTLLVKIQTAMSILIDQNPEAVFKAMLKKYKGTSAIAQAIWKRSWAIAKSKEQLKVFMFNLAKYGWAPARTYPRLVQQQKKILTELDTEHPEKNKYKEVTITDFNDIYREALDPWRTWMDDMANMTDEWSLNDWYFEKDYSRDEFENEFGNYTNADKVQFGGRVQNDNADGDVNEETKHRDDIITIGFYENKRKDLYAVYAPNDHVVIYYSPLPNDEGLLSLWECQWTIRDPKTRYGIGLFEMLKNSKVLYDRLDNMDIDQLVLSIYTMLFYSGNATQIGDGNITLSPGVMKQKLPGTTIDQVKIDYSGKGREGAMLQLNRIDDITGITPTLQGQVEGKTLGEVLHAKDAALKRLNIPLGNIANGLEKDAYLTLSWANQVYSLPDVMEFVSQSELDEYMLANERTPSKVQFGAGDKLVADFPRVLDLSLDKNREGELIESPDARFFTIGGQGEDSIEKKGLNWKGQITVNPQSIVASSQELDRQRKLELFNLVTPIISQITMMMAQGQFQMALDMAKPCVQILEIQNEEPEDWLPDKVVALLEHPEAAAQMEMAQQQAAQQQAQAAQPLFVDPNAPPEEQNPAMAQNGASGGMPGGTPTAPSSQGPEIPGVVPKDQIKNPLKDSVNSTAAVRT